jgi:hypothetical protein
LGYGTGIERGQWYLEPSTALGFKQNPHIGHKNHLCAMAESGDVTVEHMKELIRNAKFMCKLCGRSAVNADNLCDPDPL